MAREPDDHALGRSRVIGAGVPLFLAGVDLMRFDLVDSRPFDSGVIFLTYRRRAAGAA